MRFVTLAEQEDITLIDSSIPVDYYRGEPVADGKWAEGTYNTGAVVFHDGAFPHVVYEARSDGVTATPGANSAEWKPLGVTDRCQAFDKYLDTKSFYPEKFWHEVSASNKNYIGLFRLTAAEIVYTHFLQAAVFEDLNGSVLAGTGITDSRFQYLVKFTVSGATAGAVSGVAGGNAGVAVTADGDYAQVIQAGAGGDTGVATSPDFNGTIANVRVYDVISHGTIDLDDSPVYDLESYLMAPSEYKTKCVFDLSPFHDSVLRLNINWKPGENAECGNIALGYASEIGGTLYDPDVGIDDYSREDTDPDFGYTYLKQGNWNDNGNFRVWFPSTLMSSVKRRFTEHRGKAVILDFNNGDGVDDTYIFFCHIQKWNIVINGPENKRIRIVPKGFA